MICDVAHHCSDLRNEAWLAQAFLTAKIASKLGLSLNGYIARSPSWAMRFEVLVADAEHAMRKTYMNDAMRISAILPELVERWH
jgi:hypothetical protein